MLRLRSIAETVLALATTLAMPEVVSNDLTPSGCRVHRVRVVCNVLMLTRLLVLLGTAMMAVRDLC